MAEPDTDIVIGARHGLRSVLERVAMVAPSDLPVLLLGETGTGKEVIARVIHNGSVRCEGPFFPRNCGALAPALVHPELFGPARGAPRGTARRPAAPRGAARGAGGPVGSTARCGSAKAAASTSRARCTCRRAR